MHVSDPVGVICKLGSELPFASMFNEFGMDCASIFNDFGIVWRSTFHEFGIVLGFKIDE